MTFYDGSTQIGTATVAGGSATFTTTALTAGAHSITATYSGDSNYGPGTSGAVAENIQDFTLAFAGGGSGTATVPAGGQAVYTLTITPVGGTTVPAGVTLGVTDPPLGMTTSFSPPTVAAGSGTTTVTLKVNLPAKAANERRGGPLGRGAIAVALGLILLPIAGRLRKARARLWRLGILVLLSPALMTGATGCGGLLGAQDFSFTVAANSGALSHTVTAKLTVK
jgi:hypothetical protein